MLRGSALFFCVVACAFVGCSFDEVCGDGADNDGNGLVDCGDPVCVLFPACTGCGDGALADDEGCDDGNAANGDGCSDRCVIEGCGDGDVDAGEECDDGNLALGDGCNDRCEFDNCGNAAIDPGEECDDGNADDSDGCTIRCVADTAITCGNARFDSGEQCDDGNKFDGDGCNARCRSEFCGDGVVQPRLGERCEGNDGCQGCQILTCGNSRIDLGEECDDGNADSTDACVFCRLARCGDGIVARSEECDDGTVSGDDGCANCRIERCGDGRLQGAELCDDDSAGCVGCQLRQIDGDAPFTISALVPPFFINGPVDSIAIDGDEFWVAIPTQGVAFHWRRDANQLIGDGSAFGLLTSMTPVELDGTPPVDIIGRAVDGVAIGFAAGSFFGGAEARSNVALFRSADGTVGSVSNSSTLVLVQSGLFFRDAVRAAEVQPGLAGGGNILTTRRGHDDEVIAIAADRRVVVVTFGVGGGASVADTDRIADAVFAADLDGDGADELVSVDGADVDLGATVVVSPVPVLQSASGDLDGDGRDDVVFAAGRSATVLLSTRGHQPVAPFVVPANAHVAINEAGELIVAGGTNASPLQLLVYALPR